MSIFRSDPHRCGLCGSGLPEFRRAGSCRWWSWAARARIRSHADTCRRRRAACSGFAVPVFRSSPASIPGRRTTHALTICPRSTSGLPMTAASSTGRMFQQGALDLKWADAVAGALDDVVLAPDEPEIAVSVARWRGRRSDTSRPGTGRPFPSGLSQYSLNRPSGRCGLTRTATSPSSSHRHFPQVLIQQAPP